MNSSIDKIDRKILRLLQSKADYPINAIADEVGLSHTPCWRRIKQLKEKGIIKDQVTILDPEMVSLGVNVFINVSLKHHDSQSLDRFELQVQNLPEVVECYLLGGNKDYLIRVATSSIQDYEQFLKRFLTHFTDIGSVNSTFALKQVKYTTALPI